MSSAKMLPLPPRYALTNGSTFMTDMFRCRIFDNWFKTAHFLIQHMEIVHESYAESVPGLLMKYPIFHASKTLSGRRVLYQHNRDTHLEGNNFSRKPDF